MIGQSLLSSATPASTPLDASSSASVVPGTNSGGASTSQSGQSTAPSADFWADLWQNDDYEAKEEKLGEGRLNKDAIVFLVDSSPFMRRETESGEVPFDISIRCIIKARFFLFFSLFFCFS